ncbi:alpha/beta-hydrolase family protein [Knoellia locipacati]|uniref:alpha/beta-hydrolase family protein n=1 Tax=Knoellia locipacati TaxID=882824 RepID=UPI00384D3FDD
MNRLPHLWWCLRLPRTRMPRASTALAVPVALGLATFPSYLPLQPVALGVLAVLWFTVVLMVTRRLAGPEPRLTGRSRQLAAGLGGGLTAYVALLALTTQNGMRARIGMDPLVLADIGVAASTAAALLVAGHGARGVWRRRALVSRRSVAFGTGLAMLTFAPASAQAAAPASDQVLLLASPVGAVRAYAGIGDSQDDATRALVAVDRLVRAGGLTREHLLVAIPTGSGWVNPEFVAGTERRFGADVATVSMQYDTRPSWVAFLLDREGAVKGARALLDEVTRVVSRLPEAQRPQVHVVGESLGATAGQAALLAPDAAHLRRAVCSTFWLGTPGGGRTGLPRETVAANDDDPIVHASPSMALVPTGGHRPWLPVISFVHAGADVVASLAVPAGAGHRYGAEQPDRLRTCP